jgi:hypothetical protein
MRQESPSSAMFEVDLLAFALDEIVTGSRHTGIPALDGSRGASLRTGMMGRLSRRMCCHQKLPNTVDYLPCLRRRRRSSRTVSYPISKLTPFGNLVTLPRRLRLKEPKSPDPPGQLLGLVQEAAENLSVECHQNCSEMARGFVRNQNRWHRDLSSSLIESCPTPPKPCRLWPVSSDDKL